MLLTYTKTETAGFLRTCAIAAALLAPFLVYFGTAKSIVAIWNSSETFAHGYIILPISLWLIWKRRKTIPIDVATPYWPALLLLAACGFGWLLAELGDVQVVRQYTFVSMIPLIALVVLGARISWSIAFPLLFLLLAVPFGDAFVNPLIEFTADFTVAALQATGIPVLRNGTHFDIPSGSWSVVEACSGVRYLISSVTLGCLYAYLTYRSRVRQAVFVAMSIIVPIIANGVRAYMIVMIGHLSGMQLAVGVDHLIYGWLFFGLVMLLMFWIGSLWREDGKDSMNAVGNTNPDKTRPASSTTQIFAAAICSLACIGIWPLYGNYIERAVFNPTPPALTGFEASWQEAAPFTQWKPRFSPASAELQRFFGRGGQEVGVSILYYREPRHDAQLISTLNRLVGEKDSLYRQIGQAVRQETMSGRILGVREAILEGTSGRVLVWHWYWIDGTVTTSDYLGKLWLAKEKFLMRGDDGAAVMVFAPFGEKPEEARAVLRDYLGTDLSLIEATLAGNRRNRANLSDE